MQAKGTPCRHFLPLAGTRTPSGGCAMSDLRGELDAARDSGLISLPRYLAEVSKLATAEAQQENDSSSQELYLTALRGPTPEPPSGNQHAVHKTI